MKIAIQTYAEVVLNCLDENGSIENLTALSLESEFTAGHRSDGNEFTNFRHCKIL